VGLLVRQRVFKTLSDTIASKKHPLKNLLLIADATELPAFFDANQHIPTRNIWFQCPWYFRKETPELLRSFVASASKVQSSGDRLYVGLVARFREVYELDEFLDAAEQNGYRQEPIDTTLIQKCILHGYRHHSDTKRGTHLSFKDEHETYIFVKTCVVIFFQPQYSSNPPT
jgi:hypothetical protein